MPLQNTSGNDTTDAYGGGVAAIPNYIENVFSTYLLVANGATQTITNNIDLSTKGGMVWTKSRTNGYYNDLYDTNRGVNKRLFSNTTGAQDTSTGTLTSFNTNGFTLDYNDGANYTSGSNGVTWTFRKQPKFFDIVTYTGDGSSNRQISHSLGSTPGCMLVKDITNTGNWAVYHKGLNGGVNPEQYYVNLNTTAAQNQDSSRWNYTAPTTTNFTVGYGTDVNNSGDTYVAYIFASNAGGFGTSGTDNVISCGSFTTDGSGNASVTLGYEPQYAMIKRTDATGAWFIVDIMRGFSNTQFQYIQANTASTESSSNASPSYLTPNATGFATGQAGLFAASSTFIYIAIRRGPMKVPTDATTVFSPNLESTSTNPQTLTTGFPVDLNFNGVISGNGIATALDRLRGGSTTAYAYLQTSLSAAESTGTGGGIGFDNNTGIVDSNWWNGSGAMYWNFRRAPGFFDEVCFYGSNSNFNVAHNLGIVPELMIIKRRSSAAGWFVFSSYYPNGFGIADNNYYTRLDGTSAVLGPTDFFSGTITSTNIPMTGGANFTAGQTVVAYLFATCAGVSKVGSYTGNGTGQAIACGFAGGARFLLIKRTDSTGDWYVFDSANGLTSSSSPYIRWNLASTAQVTGNNGVYASTGGFTLGATAITTTNIATATYIFLAIA